ncbi:hypothetical protein ACFVYE_33840 [Streptomyces sp. NPDC058239]|uniref:hypothetical protein n=1 Tax=unclassified Streptomyces TaxID=2593676 RepID=UPI0036697632
MAASAVQRDPYTILNYLGAALPVLIDWSGRYQHLHEARAALAYPIVVRAEADHRTMAPWTRAAEHELKQTA